MLLSHLGRTDVAININRQNKEFTDVVSVADVAIVRFVVGLSQVHHDHLLLDEIVHDRNGCLDAISWNIDTPWSTRTLITLTINDLG